MLMAFVLMLMRLALSCITLALRIALALAALAGRLLGYLILGIWRAWRHRRAGKVPLRAQHIEISAPQPDALPPPPPTVTTFTPRPLRPRPRR